MIFPSFLFWVIPELKDVGVKRFFAPPFDTDFTRKNIPGLNRG